MSENTANQISDSLEFKIAKWLLTGNTGISSKTMASIALCIEREDVDVPYDISDLGRCYYLVKEVPEITNRILMLEPKKVIYNRFMPFIWQWNNLSKMYEIYLEEGKNKISDNSILLSMFLKVLRDCEGDFKASENALTVAREKLNYEKEQKVLFEKNKKLEEEKAKAEYEALPTIKKRPILDESVIRLGAKRFVEEIALEGKKWLSGSEKDFIDFVVQNWDYDDGYNFSQKMNREGWIINRNQSEDLDMLETYISKVHKELITKWIDQNKITPPYPIGSHVKFFHNKQSLTGVIKEDGIGSRHYFGQYVIELDGMHNYVRGCPIVNWEDVVID